MKEFSTLQFEKLTKTRYLEHLVFDSKKTYDRVKALCRATIEKKGADKGVEWLGFRYRKEVLSGFVNDVTIKWIDNRFGFGLFANKSIEKGEFIGEYVGVVRPLSFLFPDLNPYCFRYPLYGASFTAYTIDAQDMCNETSFINHSSHPNCEALVTMNNNLLHICIIACRRVEKGEQISYDYGMFFRFFA